MDLYLDHIDKDHRGQPLGDVIEYKTRCISTRVADDNELFDINIWPFAGYKDRETSVYLSDDLLRQPQQKQISPTSRLPLAHVFRERTVSAPSTDTTLLISHQGKLDTHPVSTTRKDNEPVQRRQSFQYQPWEDNPAEIWGISTGEAHSSRNDLYPINSYCKLLGPSLNRTQPKLESPLLPPSLTASSPRDLTASTMHLQMYAGPRFTDIPSNPQIGITVCAFLVLS